MIEALPRTSEWLFPNPREEKKHLTTIKHAWQTARDESNLFGYAVHDLRHAAASIMINAGVDLFTVGKVQVLCDCQSTQRYSHLANETVLAAVEAGAKKQNAAATKTP